MSKRRNASLALSLAMMAAGMILLAYASVPLYRLFCQATGFGGRAQPVASRPAHSLLDRRITVRFDANVDSGLPWIFTAPASQTVRIGEQTHVDYTARSRSRRPTVGTATFNVTPTKAGKYFSKIQCFCFTDQKLGVYRSRILGVTFFIDPDIAKDPDCDDVDTMTLSYTFFPVRP